jgi:hypothetical protein
VRKEGDVDDGLELPVMRLNMPESTQYSDPQQGRGVWWLYCSVRHQPLDDRHAQWTELSRPSILKIVVDEQRDEERQLVWRCEDIRIDIPRTALYEASD